MIAQDDKGRTWIAIGKPVPWVPTIPNPKDSTPESPAGDNEANQHKEEKN